MNRRFFLTTICMAFGAIALPKHPNDPLDIEDCYGNRISIKNGVLRIVAGKGVRLTPVGPTIVLIQT